MRKRAPFAKLLKNNDGSASIFTALAIFPMLLMIGLMADSGMAWISRANAMSGTESAAAVAALHLTSCADTASYAPGSEIYHNAAHAFEIATGEPPAGMTISCDSDVVSVAAHIPSQLSFMLLVHAGPVNVGMVGSAKALRTPSGTPRAWQPS